MQVNLSEMVNGRKGIRQHGFQECDIVSMARPVTKYRQTNALRLFILTTHPQLPTLKGLTDGPRRARGWDCRGTALCCAAGFRSW